MKYVKPNSNIPGVFDTYELLDYNVNRLSKIISGRLIKLIPNTEGYIDTSIESFNISDQIDIMLDPEWSETSSPIPKPAGFDQLNPMTWGDLGWDDIPKIQNPDKLYSSIIINSVDKENAIFACFINNKTIPADGTIVE